MPDNKKLTHDEFDRRVREAMKPPRGAGQGFSPAVNKMRQEVRPRAPMQPRRRATQ